MGTYDESELCKLLLEISLLDSVISDPLPAVMMFLWTPPNVTEWIPKSCKESWPKNSPQNETRKQIKVKVR